MVEKNVLNFDFGSGKQQQVSILNKLNPYNISKNLINIPFVAFQIVKILISESDTKIFIITEWKCFPHIIFQYYTDNFM